MKIGIVDDSGFMRLVLKKIVSQNNDLEYVWDAFRTLLEGKQGTCVVFLIFLSLSQM